MPFHLPYSLLGALQTMHTSICWSQTQSTHQNRGTSTLLNYHLCANPRTSPRHGHTVHWPNSSPCALKWLMVCAMEQEQGTGLGAMQHSERSWLRSWTVPGQEFAWRSITQVVTFISLDFYQKPFYENARMPHHIAAFTSSPFSLPLSLSQKLKLHTVLKRPWIHL